MIIVLKGADASSKNIGKINLPIELDEKVVAFFDIVGNNNLTDKQKNAVNRLYYDMKNNGILSHVEYLFLPCVANDVSKALVNLAGDDMEIIDGSPVASLSDGELIVSRDGNAPKFYLPKMANCGGHDFHWLSLPAKSDYRHMFSIGDSSANLFAVPQDTSGASSPYSSNYRTARTMYDSSIRESALYFTEQEFVNKYSTSWWLRISVPDGRYLGGWMNEENTISSLTIENVLSLPSTFSEGGKNVYLRYANAENALSEKSGIIGVSASSLISIGHTMTHEMLLTYQSIVADFITNFEN